MKKTRRLAVKIIAFVSLLSLAACYFIFTNNGSTFIVKSALAKYTRSKNIDIRKSVGSLARGLVFYDVEIKDSKMLLRSNFIMIQTLEANFGFFNPGTANLKIYNGRLQIPSLGLINFQGTLTNGILDANIYSKGFNVEGVVGLSSEIGELKDISGPVSGIDIYLKGAVSEPEFNGKCKIEKLVRNGFSLSNCPAVFDLRLKYVNREPKLSGTVSSNSGTLARPRTARINLGESKISFFGDPKQAILDLRGTASVEGIKISIILKGTFDKPELKLTSEPSLPQERLLVMLVTGKSWKATEMALTKGQLSPDLVKDLVDYFIFSGSESNLGQKLGISDISVTFEQQKKGVGLTKSITEKMNANYAVEQSQEKEEMSTVTQKIGGEYRITQDVSIGAEKELKQEDRSEVPAEEQKANDKVMIKFKKSF